MPPAALCSNYLSSEFNIKSFTHIILLYNMLAQYHHSFYTTYTIYIAINKSITQKANKHQLLYNKEKFRQLESQTSTKTF